MRDGVNPTVQDAQTEALKPATQWRLLARGIPALSYAAAVNPIDKLDPRLGSSRNFSMPGLRDTVNLGWPQERITGGEYDRDWFHSDFKDVAMPYVYPMYEKMLDIGQLREVASP